MGSSSSPFTPRFAFERVDLTGDIWAWWRFKPPNCHNPHLDLAKRVSKEPQARLAMMRTTMLEPAFEALGPMLESEDPASSLDYLIGRFREAKDYHLIFEAMLMKKRLELDLPLIQAPNLAALPPDLQAKYQQFLVEAAQETGELLLAN